MSSSLCFFCEGHCSISLKLSIGFEPTGVLMHCDFALWEIAKTSFAYCCCRAIVPWFVLAVHGAVHVGFVGLAAQVPGWCMQQQIHRIEVPC